MYAFTGLPEGAEATLGGMLMIKTSSLAHAGNYTCMVTNIAGSRTAHLEVTVLGACVCVVVCTCCVVVHVQCMVV